MITKRPHTARPVLPARRGGVEVSEVQRSRMLNSAMAVVREHGYGQMSVARVTESARVSRRTFYEVFADREDCFLAVFEDALAQAEAEVVGAYRRERAWNEQVRAGLIALLSFLDERHDVATLLFVDALRAGPRVLHRRGEILASMSAALDAGAARGQGGGRQGELTGEGVVGAVFTVIHTRLLAGDERALSDLIRPLMAIVALPYRGAAAARRERRGIRTPASRRRGARSVNGAPAAAEVLADPLAELPMRLTYRTLRVLGAIEQRPDASNREVAERAGVADAGQISKLLARLERLGLIVNTGPGHAHGEPNAWVLTALGERVQSTVASPQISVKDLSGRSSNQFACVASGRDTPNSLERR